MSNLKKRLSKTASEYNLNNVKSVYKDVVKFEDEISTTIGILDKQDCKDFFSNKGQGYNKILRDLTEAYNLIAEVRERVEEAVNEAYNENPEEFNDIF